ncbi:MAG: STAS domain-containing protein [Planctomycetes bacterium]|nr:STAS domain-containing protein [Planctomycetota bacterium]
MPIQIWSDDILLVDTSDEPAFSEDLAAVMHRLDGGPPRHVVVNMSAVAHINSSNISQMLRLRQKLVKLERRMRVCSVPNHIWGVMMTTGLDKVFEFSPDVPSALAAMQLGSKK